VAISHAVFARVALASAPAGAVAELHARRAEDLAAHDDDRVELRAYHIIRGSPDFEAFVLVEETARMRLLRGDHESAIAALREGMYAARSLMSKGDGDAAASAWSVFGRKLADIQIDHARYYDAHAILEEVLDRLDPMDPTRIDVLGRLEEIAEALGRPDEIQQRRREAEALAQRRSGAPSVDSASPASRAMPLPLPRSSPRAIEVTTLGSGFVERHRERERDRDLGDDAAKPGRAGGRSPR